MTDTLVQQAQRGRPSGPELVAMRRGLRLDDLALLRAVINGMGPSAAARRYLPELATDPRVVRSHLLGVVREAQAHLVGLGESELGAALTSALRDDVALPEAVPTPAIEVPSLDEFAQRFDADMFSEQELAELYAEEFCAPASPDLRVRDVDAMEAALRGLALVQSRCVQTPQAGDSVSMWLSPRLCAQLRPFGVLSLADLVVLINRLGRTWWRDVPGLGKGRAQRLLQWLVDHQAYLGLDLSPRVMGGAAVPVAVASTGVALPSLRRVGVNALGAGTDTEALQAWLASLSLKSPHTLKAYRRDAERLLVWARERGRDLTTLVVQDAVDHAQFLLDPPAHWINSLPAMRSMPDWRPMRGALSLSSANRALAAIGHLYGFLVESGYLEANPFARVRSVAGNRASSVRLDTTRSFSGGHLAAIKATLAGMPDDVAKRRLVAILMLAETTGLRIAEFTGHTWGELRPLRGDDQSVTVLGLPVVGKGKRERIVPLRPSVIEALKRHRADRQPLVDAGVVPELQDAQVPLISVIKRGLEQRDAEHLGHLSVAGVHRVLKQFFRRVAEGCESDSVRQDLERASAHWLRHTFAHEVLKASGKDLPLTQQLLGHTSISTTGQYLKAEMTQRVDVVLALPERFH